MKFKNKEIDEYSLDELNNADWELAVQEFKFTEAMKHPKFEKIKPIPTMNPSFVALREEIKKQIQEKQNV